MTIESIKLKSPKNPNIFVVVADGEEYIVFSDIIVKYALCVGKELNKSTLDKVVEESDYIICLNKATQYLSSRLKTTKQLKDYLYSKGFKSNTINQVISKLEEYQVVNDTFYSEMFIKSNEGRLSKKKIEEKLCLKGIKKENISEDINSLSDNKLCMQMAKKFMKNKEMTKDIIAKLIRHLQYKGFEWDTINKVLKNMEIEDDWN